MTLIEILVVLVIVVGLFATTLMVTSLLTFSALNGATARLATTIEHIYGRSAINGQRYRLVLDLDENAYWAECSDQDSPGPAAPSPPPDQDAGAHGFTSFDDDAGTHGFSRYDQDGGEGDPFGMNLENTFDDCTEELIPRVDLPDDVHIEAVMTTHQTEPVEEGQATIEFFPDGFVEPAMVWIGRTDKPDAVMTLRVDPMTGRVRVESGRAEVPDDFLDREEDR